MNISVSSASYNSAKADVLIIPMYDDAASFSDTVAQLSNDIPAVGIVTATGDFKGAKKTQAWVYTGIKNLPRILLVGLGSEGNISTKELRLAAGRAVKTCMAIKAKSVSALLSSFGSLNPNEAIQAFAEGAILSQYKFDKYITKAPDAPTPLQKISYLVEDKSMAAIAKKAVSTAQAICEGVTLARNLANAPNNEIYPETLAKSAQEAGKAAGVKVSVLDKRKIQALRMGGLLSVNLGSERPPVFIIMEYKGGKSNEKPIVLVGKGVTFDTGGISIKPGAGMSDMKLDMHGAATVIGAIIAAAKLKIPRNVIALVPATDNMPDGKAYVPGDIVRFMNGKTAEIDNTDAEGRLILADALTYADRYKPQAVVDFATLTGACVVALGNVTSGLMGTDATLKDRIKAAADRTSEYVCELPIYEEYEDLIKSDVADVKNSGGRAAGTITAALFLKKFIGDYPWAHIDIAGTGITSSGNEINPKGGSGVGVRLMVDMLRNWQ